MKSKQGLLATIFLLISVFVVPAANAKVTYYGENGIKAKIMDSNSVASCVSCHYTANSGSGYVNLSTYSNLWSYRSSANTNISSGNMPYANSDLNTNEKNLFAQWVADGAVAADSPTIANEYSYVYSKSSTYIQVSIDPNGYQPSSYVFNYSTSNNGSWPNAVYSTNAQENTVGSGGGGSNSGYSSVKYVNTTLTGLSCGTTYYWRAYATNSYGTGYSSTNSFTTSACNFGPTITTTSLNDATEETLFTQVVSATDSENDTISFGLSVAPTGMSINASTGQISWTPTEAQSGNSYGVTVTATDSTADVNSVASKSFSINALEVNDKPTITSSPSTSATEDVLYSYQLTTSDPDDSSFSYSLLSSPSDMSIEKTTGQLTWSPVNGQTTSGTVIVQVSDDDKINPKTDTQNFIISVTAVNDPPRITSSAIVSATEDFGYVYQMSAEDEEGKSLTYSLNVAPEGMKINAKTGEITWSPSQTNLGANNVEVYVTDDFSSSVHAFTVNVAEVNDTPVLTSTAITSATENVPYVYDINAIDEEGDPLTYSLTTAPIGMSIDSGSGLLQWTPTDQITDYSEDVVVSVSDGHSSVLQSFSVAVSANNDAPVVTSVAVTTVDESSQYVYSVTASDPENVNLTYSLTLAPADMFIDSETGVISWTPIDAISEYTEDIVLSVSDGVLSSEQSYTLTVTADNDSPSFTSVASTDVAESTNYTYQAVAVDGEGAVLTYTIVSGPEEMQIDASSGYVTWTVTDALTDYNQLVEIAVTDGVNTTEQHFTLNITADNDKPTFSSVPLTSAEENISYQYQAVANDLDSSVLTYSLVTHPVGMTIDSETGTISWTPPQANSGYSEAVVVEVTDGTSIVQQDFTVVVSAVNEGPIFEAVSVVTASEQALYQVTLVAEDPENDSLVYSLTNGPTGMTVSGATISWTPPEASEDYQESVVVGVTDGFISDQQQFTITISADNDAPSFSNLATQNATENINFSFDINATDPESQTLTYSLNTALDGLTIEPSSGILTWLPPQNTTSYQQLISVAVTDGDNTATDSFTINVEADNDPPVFTSSAVTNAQEGIAYRYTATAEDGESDDLSYSLQVGPSDMVIDATTGTLNWLPQDADDNYTEAITIAVTDGVHSVTQSFVLNVVADADTPVFSSTPITLAEESILYQYTVAALDEQNDPLTYSLSNAPQGMTIDSVSGQIAWTPNQAKESYSEAITVNVSDGQFSSEQSFNIVVSADNDKPEFSSQPITQVAENQLYQYAATGTDVDIGDESLVFSIASGPTGMTIDDTTGVVSWQVPAANENNAQSVSLLLSDGESITTQTFVINVSTINDGPLITSSAITSATENISYQYQLTVNDPDDENNGTDLTFTLTQAPEGMTVNTTGLIAWTPSDAQVGEYAVTVVAADGGEDNAQPDTQSFVIDVLAVNDAPVISSAPSTSAVRFSQYQYQVEVVDPDDQISELHFSLQTEHDAITLSETGLLTWTPGIDDVNSGTIVITVADGGEDGAVPAEQTFNITVNVFNAPPEITSEAIVSATEDTEYQYQLVVSDLDDENNGIDLRFSLENAPEGMAISATGLITWTPLEGVTVAEQVNVIVTDGGEDDSQPAVQLFDIAVTAVNDPAIITSTPPIAALEGQQWQYQVVVVDPDDAFETDVTLLVESQLGEALQVSDLGLLSWTPEEGTQQSGEITITVADGGEDGAMPAVQSFNIAVTSVNQGPQVAAVLDLNATEDELYEYALVVSDPDDQNDGESISYSIISGPEGLNISPTGVLSWTPREGQLTSDEIIIQVSDGGEDDAEVAMVNFVITVLAVDDAPLFESQPELQATEGELYSYLIAVHDEETAMDELQLTLVQGPEGMSIAGDELTWTPSNQIGVGATYDVDVVMAVSDGVKSTQQQFTLTVTTVNDAPTYDSIPLTSATEDEAYIYDVVVSDLDEDALELTLLSGPSGMELLDNQLIWTPIEGVLDGIVNLSVSDGLEHVIQTFTIVVTPVNDAPSVNNVAAQTIVEKQTISMQLTAVDIDSEQLTWSLVDAPNGMLISESGVLSWVAPEFSAGQYSIVIAVDDGSLSNNIAETTWQLTVSMLDADSDLVADYIDNCPLIVNPVQLDTNTDGQGDACDEDDDGDGITDTVEVAVGLDPKDSADALLDLDGDGLSNIDEFLLCLANNENDCLTLTEDSVAPVIVMTQSDVSVVATGSFTAVELTATATDLVDGPVAVTLDRNGPYAPGRHELVWQAQDAYGNKATATQHLDVLPLVSLTGSQVVGEGQQATANIRLNGEAPAYPVSVDYVVTGTASDNDIGLTSGTVILEEGQVAPIMFDVANDNEIEDDETVIIQITQVTGFAELDPSDQMRQQTLLIVERNVAPEMTLTATQNSMTTSTVYRDLGTVTVDVTTFDANNDPLNVTLVVSDDIDDDIEFEQVNSHQIRFEIDQIAQDFVKIIASADDGSQVTLVTKRLSIQATTPILSANIDSDGDGVADSEEGFGDIDNDKIPDYLDAYIDPSVLAISPDSTELMVTDGGLQIVLGDLSAANQSGRPVVAMNDIVNSGGESVTDQAFSVLGGIFDFEILGLNELNREANIVIPLTQTIPFNATYRKFDGEQWLDFVLDANNHIASALKVNGVCPSADSADYQTGLVAFDNCIRLTINDGGPNDADGVVNGVIVDPGGIAVSREALEQSLEPDTLEKPTEQPAGGSSFNLYLLLACLMILVRRNQRSWPL